jgi:transaldolase/glucose-6-phosphate isomerase
VNRHAQFGTDDRWLPADLKAAIDAEMKAWRKDGVRRLWAGDTSLWSGHDEDEWLGWLRIAQEERTDTGPLARFADAVQGKISDAVLIGMGGSSLGPEVLGESFGCRSGWPRLHVLDSTDPAQIAAVEHAVDLSNTLFIVSSKSGSTLEPNVLMDYFFDRAARALGRDHAAVHFAAVTDPGSSLERHAKAQDFGWLFHGVKSIGGRYSVLSKFGLVPAAAIGIDIERLLAPAVAMQEQCRRDAPEDNPGVALGIALGVAASQFGRDKLTIIASPEIADFGAWLEQLLAESTGKNGRGIIPVDGEPLGAPDRYGADRLFVHLELDSAPDAAQRDSVMALAHAGHPVLRIAIKDVWQIGAEFFRWEIATAVAGAIIGVNPFDQPDVEASKEKTRTLIAGRERGEAFPTRESLFAEGGIALYADPRNAAELGDHDDLAGYLKSHFARVYGGQAGGDYVALLAYIARNAAHTQTLNAIRERIRDRTRAATVLGFGPRFQHSTGQAYKGGPNSGVFMQITCDDTEDLPVPGKPYSFGDVKAAQAQGDLDTLVERGRRALRIHLSDVGSGLTALERAVATALG